MTHFLSISPSQCNIVYKVDNSGLKFILNVPGYDFLPTLILIDKHQMKDLYKIVIDRTINIFDLSVVHDQELLVFELCYERENVLWQECFLSWNSNKLKLGLYENKGKLLFVYDMIQPLDKHHHEIGYVRFNVQHEETRWFNIRWHIEMSPVKFEQKEFKKFEEKLRWYPVVNGKLPVGAMIGGFEGEPTYIARVQYMDVLCPGKYILSHKKAYISWDTKTYMSSECEILCGYNATWEHAIINKIPCNAFAGGISSSELIYITRIEHERKLLVGKICPSFEHGTFPYEGREIQSIKYEILVTPRKPIPVMGIPHAYG